MSEQSPSRQILFTYDSATPDAQKQLLTALAERFRAAQLSCELLALTGSRPDEQFQNHILPIKRTLYLHFNFDCLGFSFDSFGETPFYNTLWTPCVTYLTKPAERFDALLSREWNINITVLCSTEKEAESIRAHYPELSDVRAVTDPVVSIEPLYEVLYAIAMRS